MPHLARRVERAEDFGDLFGLRQGAGSVEETD
jgi:hypothetical protein